jgi:hypothetical protein
MPPRRVGVCSWVGEDGTEVIHGSSQDLVPHFPVGGSGSIEIHPAELRTSRKCAMCDRTLHSTACNLLVTLRQNTGTHAECPARWPPASVELSARPAEERHSQQLWDVDALRQLPARRSPPTESRNAFNRQRPTASSELSRSVVSVYLTQHGSSSKSWVLLGGLCKRVDRAPEMPDSRVTLSSLIRQIRSSHEISCRYQ